MAIGGQNGNAVSAERAALLRGLLAATQKLTDFDLWGLVSEVASGAAPRIPSFIEDTLTAIGCSRAGYVKELLHDSFCERYAAANDGPSSCRHRI